MPSWSLSLAVGSRNSPISPLKCARPSPCWEAHPAQPGLARVAVRLRGFAHGNDRRDAEKIGPGLSRPGEISYASRHDYCIPLSGRSAAEQIAQSYGQ